MDLVVCACVFVCEGCMQRLLGMRHKVCISFSEVQTAHSGTLMNAMLARERVLPIYFLLSTRRRVMYCIRHGPTGTLGIVMNAMYACEPVLPIFFICAASFRFFCN